MNRDAAILIALGVIMVGVLAVVGLGAFGTTRTVSESGGWAAFPDPPADGASGVVFDLIEQPGQSIFGIHVTSSSHLAHIGMVVADECVSQGAEGQEVLSQEGACAELPAHGEVSGGGVTIDGGRLVIVRLDISGDCFQALGIGETWPSTASACEQVE